ncbi:MAG: hypothetical protein ACOCQ3_05495 [Natronomonas sp.]
MITEEQRENFKRLHRARVEPSKPSEKTCPECHARITVTESVGEAGHRFDCPRRESRYSGKALQNSFGTGRFGEEGSA